LPGWVDDEPRELEFIFNDGTRFTAPNSQKMAMGPGSMKYRPEDPGEGDPRKQHPKVCASKDSVASAVYVKVR